MAETELVQFVLEDVVVDVVEQVKVLCDDCSSHLFEFSLKVGQVAHYDLNALAEEAGFEGAGFGPLPLRLSLLLLLNSLCACNFSCEETAFAGEEVSDHFSAPEGVVVVVESRAEAAHCQQQLFYQ